MQWIHHYQLFLFDFDGVLVNTEHLHYQAYKKMCEDRGFSFDWDWCTYARAAMFESTGLKEALYASFPNLQKQEPRWEVLYEEKKKAYAQLLKNGGVQLMPGVEALLKALEAAKIKRCVVTHSSLEQVSMIKAQQPLLNTIPAWITREDYSQPKPNSECYKKAISLYARAGDKIIGFEDSPRGLKALLGSEAKGVFVSSLFEQKEIAPLMERAFLCAPSFTHLSNVMG